MPTTCRRSHATFFLGVVALASCMLACGGNNAASSSAVAADAATPLDASADAESDADASDVHAIVPAGHKPVIDGLIDKGSEAAYHAGQPYGVTDPAIDATLTAKIPAMSGLVINQTWAQLEPSQGTFDFSVLDQSLAAVATYNASHASAPLGARLRIFAAYAAPAWAKTLDGPAIATSDSGTPATVGQWWGPNYRAAWAALQTALAARYDGNAALEEVAVSSCAASTAEPMVIDTDTLNAAKPSGYTTDQEHDCLIGAFSDYAGWKTTSLYFPFNPVAGDATVAPDILQRCATSLSSGGPLCILANNALDAGSDASTTNLGTIYAGINTAWSANPITTFVGFQMNGPTTSTWCGAIQVAVTHHAASVELWPNGYDSVDLPTLQGWSDALRTGVAPACN